MEENGVRAFTQLEIARRERIDRRNIKKKSELYIPVFFENSMARQQFKVWRQKNPYSVRYIRAKDLDVYFRSIKKSDVKKATEWDTDVWTERP